MLTKLEIYEKAKSAYIMDYNYQTDKVTEFIKKAKISQNEKEYWQKYVDIFQTESNNTYEKIREIIDLISKEKEKEEGYKNV